MRTAAVLPVKRFSQAKQRLRANVADPLRGRLIEAMVSDVLNALASVEAIDLTIVITVEPAVAAAARETGALVVEDAEQGQSAAASLGVLRAIEMGSERVLCVPGDCPGLDPAELEALLAEQAPATPEVVIVPDRHHVGTNALLLTPPDAIAPSFGPGSFARHQRLARQTGLAWRVERPPSLLLDVDTGEDLAALHERLISERAAAPRTRAALSLAEGRWRSSRSAA